MAHSTAQGRQLLNGWKRLTRFEKGLGASLPEAYRKFWREWKVCQPVAVHYVPKESQWQRDIVTGQLLPVQDIPLPLIDTPESHQGIWGGEAVVKGFQKRSRHKRRVPHFWVPVLRRSVLYSKVLDKYMSVVITDRTMEKIHESQGFDHYLLKTPACDLRSLLALKIKRHILLELLQGCPNTADRPELQKEILQEYKCYLESYTPEEIEWYGYSFEEAIRKLQAKMRAENPVIPHKTQFRSQLIEQLKQAGIKEAGGLTESTSASKSDGIELSPSPSQESTSGWFSKINPFGRSK